MKFVVQKTLLNKLKILVKYFNVHKCITLIFFILVSLRGWLRGMYFKFKPFMFHPELILKYILLNTKSKSHKNI